MNHHQTNTNLYLTISTLYLIYGLADFFKNETFANEQHQLLTNNLVSNNNDEWSKWSHWTPCSKICDGGVSFSFRRCLSKLGCNGDHKRYKICNMQPCTEKTDFRQTQCNAFNDKPYRDRYYEWISFIDSTDPCSLTCKAKGLNFVAKLAPRVKDGTRCKSGSLDVCVSGKCLSVGCDLQLGSLKKIDECGVCGGDGSSCQKYNYLWSHRFLNNCSRSCGGGFQTSTVICFNENLDKTVDDIYCSTKEKPKSETKNCNEKDCEPSWISGEWSECDKKCGTGLQIRTVHCVVEQKNGAKKKIENQNYEKCPLEKRPENEQNCNVYDCPQWYEGPWSECSENCGNGFQTRSVICKDYRGLPSDQCDMVLKPISQKNCSDISECLFNQINSQEDSSRVSNLMKNSPNEPNFYIQNWTLCNATCGFGFRKRIVECKIYLEFSKAFITIPKNECPGLAPTEIETCFSTNCTSANEKQFEMFNVISNLKYEWAVTGFTNCSTYCLGGTQETIIECVQKDNNQTVSNIFCADLDKPETFTKTCNDQPCVPRWNVTEFRSCSKKCGEGGFQNRMVRCVHEIARGSNNFIIVPDHQCKDPMPIISKPCNQFDCPARWTTGSWQKCTKDCGGGVRTRQVFCVKDFYIGGLRNLSFTECSLEMKPKNSKVCNLKACQAHKNPRIELYRKSKRNNIDSSFKNNQKRMLTVQGKAKVFEGDRLKLFCLDWDDRLSKLVYWFKGHDPIFNKKRFSMFKNILKIRNVKLSDTGVYKCTYDNETLHSMFLHVLPISLFSKASFHSQNNNGTIFNKELHSSNHYGKNNFYYQNELDVSQEMEQYSLRSGSSKPSSLSLKDEKTNKNMNFSFYSNIKEYEQQKSTLDNFPKIETFSNHDFGQSFEDFFKEKDFKIKNQNQENNSYKWITTQWSNCTIPCGGIGFKIRFSQCYSESEHFTKIVEDSNCLKFGLSKPNGFEKCGLENCFSWKIGPWSRCENCVDTYKGMQSRNVQCFSKKNETVIDDESICLEQQNKPNVGQQCVNDSCVAIWLVGEWSKCNSECEQNGFRSRSVQCIWKLTKQLADNKHCDNNEARPSHIETCVNRCL